MADISLHDHYHQPDLGERIVAALAAVGVPADAVDRDDLALVDEFHIRGRDATRELAACAALAPGHHVLDLGCGLGGPARLLAAECGCRVTGVDLIPGFCAAAMLLTRLVGLDDRVAFLAGDVRQLPFAAGGFDRVWSLHTQMNIADKAALAREIRRVLRPDGAVVLYEVCAGDGRAVHLPVPWAGVPSHSHLVPSENLRAAFTGAGFTVTAWEDHTAAAVAWLDGVAAERRLSDRPRSGPRPDLSLVMGPDASLKSRNLGRNLREGRVVVVRGFCRPAVGCGAS